MSERTDLPSPSATNFEQRVRETLMTYLGRQGDPLDRGLTLRDLVDAGIISLSGRVTSGGSLPIVPGPNAGGGTTDEVDLTPPPQPTGFKASAAISNLIVECDAPLYLQGNGHGFSILYGAQWTGGPLPVFTDAVKLTQFAGTVTSHATNPGTTWHLWLTWVTRDGVESPTPAGGTNGIVARTGENVSSLVQALTGPGNPFVILSVPTTIGGVTYPAGTYSAAAFIMDLQVTRAKIADLAVDNAKIASVSVDKLTAGSLAVGQYIQSSNYIPDSAGWRIDANGRAEMSNAIVRGGVFAQYGTIGGITLVTNALRSGQSDFNVGTGFYLDASGRFSVGDSGANRLTWDGVNLNIVSPGFTLLNGAATFSGRLSAASGTFSGNLSAASGTFRGDITGATGVFAGTLRAGTIDLGALVGSNQEFRSSAGLLVPAGLSAVKVTLVGGGGGGGRGHNIYTRLTGSGGGSGGLWRSGTDGPVFTGLAPGLYCAVEVGQGGAGGQDMPSTGSTGGSTSFYINGTLVARATGGAGGQVSGDFNNARIAGGAGGSPGGVAGGATYSNGSDQPNGGPGGGLPQYGPGGAAGYYDFSSFDFPGKFNGKNGTNIGSGGGGGIGAYVPGPNVQIYPTAGNGAAGYALLEFYDPNGVVLRQTYEILLNALRRQNIQIV